jgi:hypothetical protein
MTAIPTGAFAPGGESVLVRSGKAGVGVRSEAPAGGAGSTTRDERLSVVAVASLGTSVRAWRVRSVAVLTATQFLDNANRYRTSGQASDS